MEVVPSLDSLLLTETVELDNDLSLTPSVTTKLVKEWKLKHALFDFLKSLLSLVVPEEDLIVKHFRELKKRNLDDAVARGTLLIRDLGFLRQWEEIKLVEWRNGIVEKMDGIELNLEGVKYKLTLSTNIPNSAKP